MAAPIYPFDVWFRRERFSLAKGRHYQCSTGSMIQQLRNAASARSLPLKVVKTRRGIMVFVLNGVAKAIQEINKTADAKDTN